MELCFIASLLQLRGSAPSYSPMIDACQNILAFNGEIYSGIAMSENGNDAQALLQTLGDNEAGEETSENLSHMKVI